MAKRRGSSTRILVAMVAIVVVVVIVAGVYFATLPSPPVTPTSLTPTTTVPKSSNIRSDIHVTNGNWDISVTNLGSSGWFEIKATFPYSSGSNTLTWTVYIEANNAWTNSGYDSKLVGPIKLEVHPK